jgi:hypothetical protein
MKRAARDREAMIEGLAQRSSCDDLAMVERAIWQRRTGSRGWRLRVLALLRRCCDAVLEMSP